LAPKCEFIYEVSLAGAKINPVYIYTASRSPAEEKKIPAPKESVLFWDYRTGAEATFLSVGETSGRF